MCRFYPSYLSWNQLHQSESTTFTVNSKSYRSLNINLSVGLMGCSETSVYFCFVSIRRKGTSQRCSVVTQYKCAWHVIQKTNRGWLFSFEWVKIVPFLHAAELWCNRKKDYTDWKLKVFGWKNSTPQWVALKCVNVCANLLLMPPPSPLFYDFLWLPNPHPCSCLRPPLSQSLSPRDLITPLLISFDRRQLIRGQHLDDSHGNRLNQIFQALKGGSRSGDGKQWEMPRDWQLWWTE